MFCSGVEPWASRRVSDMKSIVVATFIGLLTFVLRVCNRTFQQGPPWRNGIGRNGDFGDAMTHLLLADMIRRNGGKIVRATPSFLLSGPQDYPALFHTLIALIPKETLEQWEWGVSPLLDAAHAVLVFVFFLAALRGSGSWSALPMAAGMTLAWLLSPSLAGEVRRTSYLNERVFGFLFSNTYFISMAAWLGCGEPLWVVAAILAGSVVAVSSKFGMQAILLITPLVSCFLQDIRPLLLLAMLCVAAMILSGGYALRVWRGSIRHTRFYARYLVRVHDYVTSFSMRQFVEAARLLSRGVVRSAVRLAVNHPLINSFAVNPTVLVALFVACIAESGSVVQHVHVSLVGAAALVGLLTSTDVMKFLGEGERYLEVAIAPALLLIANLAPTQAPHVVVGLIIYSVLRLALVWRMLSLVRRNAPASSAVDTRELLNWLAEHASRIIYAVPGRLAYPIAYVAPQHRHIWCFLNAPERERQEEYERLFEGGSRYPYPAPQQAYAKWRGERADIAILHKPTVAACKAAWGIDYDAIVGERVFSNHTYLVVAPNADLPHI